jgi:hypothetical protein
MQALMAVLKRASKKRKALQSLSRKKSQSQRRLRRALKKRKRSFISSEWLLAAKRP